jgi:hydroxyethylthiazole kinase-like uncharacterized protein yjeF
VIAGSARMPGAAYLVGQSAMRAGAGLVTIACPEPLLPVLGAKVIVQTLAGLPATRSGTLAFTALQPALQLAPAFDGVALGPGLTTDEEVPRFVRELVQRLERPLVLDADGLNAFAGQAELLSGRPAPTVLTPHPGEMGRLMGCSAAEVQADRAAAATSLARRLGVVVVLKGAGTVVTDGTRTRINRTGNAGMATGGAGDVLTGVIGALLCRGMSPLDAAILGAHLHGRAGDFAKVFLGEEGLLAADLLDYLPRAIRLGR